MKKYLAAIAPALLFLFLTFFPMDPAIALEVSVGQQVELNASNPLGVPFHEFPRPSLMGRIRDGETATVIRLEENTNWINIRLADERAGWVVERYIGRVIAGPVDSNSELFTVATFNVKNLDPKKEDITKVKDQSSRNVDDDIEKGQFREISQQIVVDLGSPDIIALQEIQDNDGAEQSPVVDAQLTGETLISAIQSAGGPRYEYRDIPPVSGQDGGLPGANIRVGFLFNPERIQLGTLERIEDEAAFFESRKPLVGQFKFQDTSVVLINSHFASKRGGSEADRQRIQQATVVDEFVEDLLSTDPNANIVVLGDLNDTPDSETIRTFSSDRLINLTNQIPCADQFSFVFRGNEQLLDYILVSPNLTRLQTPEIDIVHVNAGRSSRASDHDPVIAKLAVPTASSPNPNPNPNPSPNPEPEDVILPGLMGVELREQLDALYSPRQTPGYGNARDLLYAQIDNQNGFVTGIYSGYRAPISPNADRPREEATFHGINAEHVWPQSRGAKGSAKSDMHNLFPARKEVNSDRSNFPFAEIADERTTSWYLDDDEFFTQPNRDIDKYSERIQGAFEPREEKEGDVARAMFYFRTVYPDRSSGSFFNSQKETLCQWDSNDPPDEEEIARSHAIANTVQGNENPFVLDPTLAKRAYCS